MPAQDRPVLRTCVPVLSDKPPDKPSTSLVCGAGGQYVLKSRFLWQLEISLWKFFTSEDRSPRRIRKEGKPTFPLMSWLQGGDRQHGLDTDTPEFPGHVAGQAWAPLL